MKKLRVNFYLKADKSKNGLAPIYAKIKLGNESTTLFTGKYISVERWNSTNSLLNAKKAVQEVSLKNYIYEIPRQIENSYLHLLKDSSAEVSLETLKNHYLGLTPKTEKTTFRKVAEFHNHHFKKRIEKGEVTYSTLEKYERVIRIFEDFTTLKYKNNSVFIEDMDEQFIYAFDDYLRYERPNGKEMGVCNNTAVKYFRNINTIMKYGLKRGIVKNNPFSVYDETLEEVDTVFLTQEELKLMENAVLPSEKLKSVRDIFLFSCYTSYAPVDAMKLTVDNIDKDSEGVEWIRTKRQKSGVKSDIPMLPPVKAIINKYKFDPRCIDENRLLPKYSNQKVNEYLKELALVCGIKKHLTWYVSRHTFATTVCLGNKVPLEYITRMMGQRKTTQTQHYAKLIDAVLKTETNKLAVIYSNN
jgi:site-specific recombinase XerD